MVWGGSWSLSALLGRVLEHLGGVSGRLGRRLGASWGCLGEVTGASYGVLGEPWARFSRQKDSELRHSILDTIF